MLWSPSLFTCTYPPKQHFVTLITYLYWNYQYYQILRCSNKIRHMKDKVRQTFNYDVLSIKLIIQRQNLNLGNYLFLKYIICIIYAKTYHISYLKYIMYYLYIYFETMYVETYLLKQCTLFNLTFILYTNPLEIKGQIMMQYYILFEVFHKAIKYQNSLCVKVMIIPIILDKNKITFK